MLQSRSPRHLLSCHNGHSFHRKIKKDGSCRLIMDFSQPRDKSINEGISKEDFAVIYSYFDDATSLVRAAGRWCLMSKVHFHIKHAFRIIPVRPADWELLGFQWEGSFFVDTRLPFGLSSSPGIFTLFADLVCCNRAVTCLPWSITLMIFSWRAALTGQQARKTYLNYAVLLNPSIYPWHKTEW